MLGEHGLWWKSSFYEPSTRVPLIAAWPGRFPAGSRVSTPVSLLDLTRTIVAAAGADADRMEGDDLQPSAFGERGRSILSARSWPNTKRTAPPSPGACCDGAATS